MLFFLISCFSFVLLSKSFNKIHSTMKSDWRFLSPWLWDLYSFQKGEIFITLRKILSIPPLKKRAPDTKNGNEDEISLLDLPELTLECVLDKLSPAGLCTMAAVCTSMREKCTSDYLWEKHMKLKWGRVIGEGAHREWQWFVALKKRPGRLIRGNPNGFWGFVDDLLGFSWVLPNLRKRVSKKSTNFLPVDDSNSIMALYVALESGKFWFPAQVYNRENGHAGFMLSCYDAHLCYDSRTNTFQARYSPHGTRMMEENISWDRLRAPPIDNPAHVLYVSECLRDLKPGDHIEIQWRRNKEFPYGWWYGLVGHLESCDQNEDHCHCQNSDIVILEFNQYTPDSRWRRTIINRKDHREEENEADGFYAGIRKVYKEDEISMWKRLWPRQILE
jgi:hypothetical protein